MRLQARCPTALALLLSLSAGCDTAATSPGGDGGPAADAGGPGTDSGGTMPMSPLVDPMCVDGRYSEALPDRSRALDDLVSAYSSAGAEAFVDGVLERRYPIGRRFAMDGTFGGMGCVDIFFSDRSSASRAFAQLSTIVHECGHAVDSSLGGFGSSTYVVSGTTELMAAMGDATGRGGATFARSRIRNDAYQPSRPACGGSFRPGCDFYADTYLDGNPDDATFDGGDQGFSMLFEELVQYVHSLATDYAVSDWLAMSGSSVSDRDGLLTFMWYVERYLRMARLDYPSAYAHVATGDSGRWRRAILTVWGRAVLFLEATETMPGLGIEDDAIMALVLTPELLEEIERLRTAEGCP